MIFIVLRCHSNHAANALGHGGRGGVASEPAPHKLHSRKLPSTTRKSLHLAEGMPGCYGKVRRREMKAYGGGRIGDGEKEREKET